MKNKKLGLMIVAFLAVLLMPQLALAQEKVTIYFFRGEGCPHCADAEEFFETIKKADEYKDKFEIKDYEVWYNKDNQKLAEKVAKAMGETLGGVPYIVIGDKSWNGFTDAYGEEIKTQITDLYNRGDYNDPVKDVLEGKKDSNVTMIIIVLVLVAVVVALHFARKDSFEVPMTTKEEKKEEFAEEDEDEKVTETYRPYEKTTTRKTSSNTPKKKTQKKKNKR